MPPPGPSRPQLPSLCRSQHRCRRRRNWASVPNTPPLPAGWRGASPASQHILASVRALTQSAPTRGTLLSSFTPILWQQPTPKDSADKVSIFSLRDHPTRLHEEALSREMPSLLSLVRSLTSQLASGLLQGSRGTGRSGSLRLLGRRDLGDSHSQPHPCCSWQHHPPAPAPLPLYQASSLSPPFRGTALRVPAPGV